MTTPGRAAAWPGLRIAVFALVLAIMLLGVWRAWPPRQLTIEVGPVGGSYYESATRYRDELATLGIELRIVPKPNSLEIIQDVATPGSGIDVGFIAQDVSESAKSPVVTIGLVQMQPLFIFASAELGRRSVLDDLRGRRIVMPPTNSATSDAAIRVMQLYDITRENSRFTFMPLADAVAALRAGKFDAGAFMLAPENEVIRDLTKDTGLHLVPVEEARAIAQHLPFLRPVTLPRGIYDIADAIPPADVPMVAAPVGVVARGGLHPFLVYSLLDAIAKVHRGATLISNAGDYPTVTGSQLEVDPLAARWAQSGTPLIWRELPPWAASFVDRYAMEMVGVLLFAALVVSVAFLAEALGLLRAGASWLRRRRRLG